MEQDSRRLQVVRRLCAAVLALAAALLWSNPIARAAHLLMSLLLVIAALRAAFANRPSDRRV